jgi:hypothetical protein
MNKIFSYGNTSHRPLCLFTVKRLPIPPLSFNKGLGRICSRGPTSICFSDYIRLKAVFGRLPQNLYFLLLINRLFDGTTNKAVIKYWRINPSIPKDKSSFLMKV